MGADNWTHCPQCKLIATTLQEQAEAGLQESYGKLPVKEWLKQKGQVERQAAKPPEQTLREDYEIGLDGEGVFEVDYRASCDKCGLRFSHKHDAKIHLTAERKP